MSELSYYIALLMMHFGSLGSIVLVITGIPLAILLITLPFGLFGVWLLKHKAIHPITSYVLGNILGIFVFVLDPILEDKTTYTCPKCNIKFKLASRANLAKCPNCNSEFGIIVSGGEFGLPYNNRIEENK